MIGECSAYRDDLPDRGKRHKDNKKGYEDSSATAKKEYERVAHDALVHGFLYKDLTEKDSARKTLADMQSQFGDAFELIKKDFESADMDTVKATAYTMDRIDDFFTVTAAVDLSDAKLK